MMSKKSTILLSIMCIIFLHVCAFAAVDMDQDTYETKVNQFISDPRWCNGATFNNSVSPKAGCGWGAGGCVAYAHDFNYYVTGGCYGRDGGVFTNQADIRSGDVLLVSNGGHTIVVLSRDGNSLYTAEGNWTNGNVSISRSRYSIQGNVLKRSGQLAGFVKGWHTVNLKKGDNQAPTISNVTVEWKHFTSLGYVVSCDVSDNVGVTKVRFPVWVNDQTGNSAIWFDGEISENHAWAYIPMDMFNYISGTYHMHIYAYDAAGNSSAVAASDVKVDFENLATKNEKTVREGIYCLKDQNEYWMQAMSDSNDAALEQHGIFSGDMSQQFYVEYVGDGKYHLRAMGASKRTVNASHSNAEIGYRTMLNIWSYNGVIEPDAQEFYLTPWGDGSYAIELASKDNFVIGGMYNGEGQRYYIERAIKNSPSQHWYFCDTNGTVLNVTPDNEAPVISSAWYEDVKISSMGYTLNSTVKDNVGVTSVKYKVWKDEDESHAVWYEAKLNGSLAQYQIPLSDFNYEMGTYHTRIYALDAEGNESKFEAESLKLVAASLETKQENTVRENIYCVKDQNTYWMEPVQESEGAIIQQTGRFTGNNSQRFKVEYIGNGKYHLVSVGVTNGLLTVDNSGEIKDGCGLKVTSKQDAAAQEFYLTPWGDGSYAIELASKDNYVIGNLNIGTGEKYLLQKAVYGATGQHWYFCDTKYGSKQDVTPARLTISAIADHQEVEVGEKVMVLASATGGAGNYTYSFLIHNLETDKWFRVAPFGTADKYVWTASGTGEREFFAEVKDTDGTVIRSEAVKVKVKAKNSELSITARTNVSEVSEGNTVTISASAVGGVGSYTYSFLIHNLENNSWYRWGFNKSAQHTWTASGTGNREFFVEVKDAAGKVVRSSAMKVTVKSAEVPLAVTGKVSTSQVTAGNTVTISAMATGGKGGYTYSFLIHNLENNSWYRWGFDKSAQHTWTASGSGSREFFVEVKDATGKVVRSSAMKVTVKSAEVPLAITGKVNASQVTAGNAVTISATATGGKGGYTYSFLVHNLANDSWYRFGSFTTASSYTWTAGSTGTREFFIEAKDANGAIVRSSAVLVNVK